MERNETSSNDNANYHGSLEKNKVEESLDVLIDAVKNSYEYQAYLSAKKRVDLNPEIKKNLDKFRAKNYEIQNNSKAEVLYAGIDTIEREAAEFRANPLVEEFLAAELALCRMIQNINWKLIGSLDFNTDFIKD